MKIKFDALYSQAKKHEIISICFLLLVAIGCHILFFQQFFNNGYNRYFFGTIDYDSGSQFLSASSLIEENLKSGNPFWSFSYGLGGDYFTEMSYYYTTSPFFYFQYLLKLIFNQAGGTVLQIQCWRLLFSVLKQFFAMLGMYFLFRQEGKYKFTSVIGALTYGCTIWFAYYSYYFDFMTDALVWPPLFMIALNAYLDNKSPVPLVIIIAATIANNFYFGFSSCVLYATILIVFTFLKKSNAKKYILTLSKLIGVSVLALMISSVAFLPGVNGLLSSDRTAADVAITLKPNIDRILRFPLMLTSENELSLPYLVFFSLFLLLYKTERLTKLKSILAAFWVFMLLIPATSNLMNGMSYATTRWFYVVIFAVSYALPDWTEEIIKNRGVTIKNAAVYSFFILITIIIKKQRFKGEITQINKLYAVFGVVSVIIIFLIQNKGLIAKRIKFDSTVISKTLNASLMLCILIPGMINCTLYYRNNSTPVYIDSETAQSMIVGDLTQRAVNSKLIPKNNEFFRVDDMSVYEADSRIDNRSWLNGTYSVSTYASEVSGDLHRWLKQTYDVTSLFNMPSYYRGFNHRLFLENAWGIKYKTNCTELPYGYVLTDIGDGISIPENTLSSGIDLWYDSVCDVQSFEAMDYAQRDAALLQTAVVDSVGSYSKTQFDNVTSYIELSDADIEYINCTYDGNNLIASDNAEIRIPLPKQVQRGEYLLTFYIKSNSKSPFFMTVNDSSVRKYAPNYPYDYGTTVFSFCVSDMDEYISFKITKDSYTLKDVRLAFNSYRELERWMNSRNRYNLENLTVDGGKISGNINNDEAGILALNIPFNKGWKCKVDNKEAELFKVNGIFTGIDLPPGSHSVELTFTPPYLITGAIISAIGVILLILIVYRKRLIKLLLKK